MRVRAREKLIADMDEKLRALKASAPKQTIRVAGWGGGGFVPGRSTLFNDVLEAAGGFQHHRAGQLLR